MKKWIISDEVYISGDETQQILCLRAGRSAIEVDGKSGEIILSGAINKMDGGSESSEIIFQSQPLPMRAIPSTVTTPLPAAIFRLPFDKVTGMVGDIATMVSFMVG